MIDYRYLAGGLTDTPQVRYTPNGNGVVSFTLAQSDSKKNDADQWETTRSVYIPVTIWDDKNTKWTDILAGLTKGTKLVAHGKLITNSWEDKEGNRRSRVEFQARHIYTDPAATAGQGSAPAQAQATGWIANDNRGGFGGNTTDENPPF